MHPSARQVQLCLDILKLAQIELRWRSQYASLYLVNIFASLKRNNLLRKTHRCVLSLGAFKMVNLFNKFFYFRNSNSVANLINNL